ncbi:MAG TPA: EscU/YscU/HrcU family type III secretion system export apparatus switch protein [Terriglobales bacterium]|nr:EscU/YscU/HrcU family type III secretion system export apparatus switch protein [Terriglobales bacterium]
MAQDNKTEKATPRRREKAREKGQVARSRDLISGTAAMAAILFVGVKAPGFGGLWRTFLRDLLAQANAGNFEFHGALAASAPVWQGAAIAVALSWGAALIAAVAQGGIVLAPSALALAPSRMSPASRVSQLFSLSALSRFLKALLPFAGIVYFCIDLLGKNWIAFLELPNRPAPAIARFAGKVMFELAWKSALVLLVWSLADYLLEKRKLEAELRMSRQELIDEYKESEGNPTVKARIRRLQRQVRRRRMLEDVKRASVVITNPTEFAVAIEYRLEMSAPVVVGKGRNLLAQQIKQAARWHGIPLVENPPLAHALYRAVEVGQSIPPKLYAVVAELLAALYRAQARASAAGVAG